MFDGFTRQKETREDVFKDAVSGDLEDPGVGFSEFSSRVDEKRKGVPLDDVGAGLAVVDDSPETQDQPTDTFTTTTDDLFSARRVHEDRSERAQSVDESRKAEVTTDFETWAENPDRFDFPGIDAPTGYEPRF